MMKIPWTQHASNEQILGVVDEESLLAGNFEKTAEKVHWACPKT